MQVTIVKAEHLIDFATHLDEINNIFFESSAQRNFSSLDEKESFRNRSLGRYITSHINSFFVALDETGSVVGYLAGCLENPTNLDHFSDIAYFKDIVDLCERYPAHFHINLTGNYRNRGLGRQLVERFVEYATLHSIEGIHIVTSTYSRSVPFYKRNGFSELRTFPWNSGVAICMGRTL